MDKYYNITDFALYSYPAVGSLIYRPDNSYQPDYPFGYKEEVSQTIHFAEARRVAWKTNYYNSPKVLEYKFSSVPLATVNGIITHIETYYGTFYVFLGTNTIGTLTYFSFQKAFLQDELSFEEDEVGLYSFSLSFKCHSSIVNVLSTAQGWGTNWGTNWGL